MSDIKYTPNPEYWKPIRAFWERIKDSEILTGAYFGLDWEELPQHARFDLAAVFKAAISAGNDQHEAPHDGDAPRNRKDK